MKATYFEEMTVDYFNAAFDGHPRLFWSFGSSSKLYIRAVNLFLYLFAYLSLPFYLLFSEYIYIFQLQYYMTTFNPFTTMACV